MLESKNWWTSRTVWVGVIGLLFAVLGAVGVLPEGLTQEQVLQGVMAVVGVLTIVFRVKADTTIG